MARYIRFPTADGGTILVEVEAEEAQTEGLVKAGLVESAEEAVIKVRDTFEATMMEALRRNADAFVNTMRDLSNPPAEAEISFGLKATVDAGYSVIAKASAESSYTVTVTWKRD